MQKYQEAIDELNRMLGDAKTNRDKGDPKRRDPRWAGYLDGIRGAIHRLDMHSTDPLPPRTMQRLTDAELIGEFCGVFGRDELIDENFVAFARAIETALLEKNK